MSVSLQEKSLRRRILFNSLDKGTPVEVVQNAIDLLENEYGNEPEIRYTDLVKRLRDSFDHPSFKSGNLLGRIMMVRNKSADDIGPDPADTVSAGGASQASRRSNQSADLSGLGGRDLVFNTLLTQVTTFVDQRGEEKAKSYRNNFLKEALKMNLSRQCGSKLVEWAKSSKTSSAISGTDVELQKIVNTAFVWMCGAFGPVDADKILLQAVKLAEQLPEAFDNSPRKFL